MQSRNKRDMKDRKRVLLLEPFYGGSHRLFADGLAAATRHEIKMLTLPARFWKWRMRGAALYFAQACKAARRWDADPDADAGESADTAKDPDLVLAGSLMSAADFRSVYRALHGRPCPPVLLYMHENQFTYPLAAGEKMDYQFAFTDITSALSADRVLFNSGVHMEMFLSNVERFIRKMPDAGPHWTAGVIREKSFVCHPGVFSKEFPEEFPGKLSGSLSGSLLGDTLSNRSGLNGVDGGKNSHRSDPSSDPVSPEAPSEQMANKTKGLVIWNHRWEHDKNPEAFFEALEAAAARGADFCVAVLGERYEKTPEVFEKARQSLGSRVSAFGYEPDRAAYFRWLRQGEVAISTALQENFGIAVVEAAANGCIPLVPNRLSYPEIIPEAFHDTCLYRSPAELEEKLTRILSRPRDYDTIRHRLAEEMVTRYSWKNRIADFNRHIAETAKG